MVVFTKLFKQVEGFYATKKKTRGKKFLFEWAQKAAKKCAGYVFWNHTVPDGIVLHFFFKLCFD